MTFFRQRRQDLSALGHDTYRNVLVGPAIGVFAMRIAGGALAFGTSALFARLMSPSEFGILALALATTTLAAPICALGFPALATKESATYLARGELGLLKGLFAVSLGSVFMASLLVAVLGIVVVGWVRPWPGMPFEVVAFSAALIPLLALNLVRAGLLRGHHAVVEADFPDLLLRPAALLVQLGVAAALFSQITIVQAIGMYLASTAVAFATGGLILFRLHSPGSREQRVEARGYHWARSALPFWWLMIVGIAETQLPLFLLGFQTTAVQVALYAAAAQPVSLVSTAILSVQMPLQARIVSAWAKGDREEVQNMAVRAARLGGVIALGISAILLPFAPIVLAAFGSEYVGAANLLRVLTLSQLVIALFGPLDVVLTMVGYHRVVLYARLAGLIVIGFTASLAVPWFGGLGAAFAVLIGTLSWNLSLCLFTYRRIGIVTLAFKRIESTGAGHTGNCPVCPRGRDTNLRTRR